MYTEINKFVKICLFWITVNRVQKFYRECYFHHFFPSTRYLSLWIIFFFSFGTKRINHHYRDSRFNLVHLFVVRQKYRVPRSRVTPISFHVHLSTRSKTKASMAHTSFNYFGAGPVLMCVQCVHARRWSKISKIQKGIKTFLRQTTLNGEIADLLRD